jgi:ferric-dicitrate binding protein FerR (iron transport regulator)
MKKHTNIELPEELRAEPDATELERVWDRLGETVARPVSPESTDAAWNRLAARIGFGRTESRVAGRRSIGNYVLRAAAVAAIALGVTATWHAIPITESADPGSRLAVVLPDGSSVELNAGSSLRYRRSFAWLPGVPTRDRTVELEGEAFFDVEPGVRPFRVEAGEASVRVLGTRFNVRARGNTTEEAVRVEVEEGRVEVWSNRASSGVILSAGEAVRVPPRSGGLVREAVLPGRIGTWRDGGLTVVDEPLSAVLRELSLRFGVRISLADPQAGTALLNVYYPAVSSLESVLADLATQQELRYRQTGEGWQLY